VVITPNQDIIFVGIAEHDREKFVLDLESYGFGMRNGQPYSALRMKSGACVVKDTCRLAYTDSEKFEPVLIDELERRGWGNLQTSIGITGCERQCFRPATKAIGLIGTGLNMYQLKLMGTEDGRHQGAVLTCPDDGQMYLRMIPRDQVANVIDALFSLYVRERIGPDEEPGYCFRRLGMTTVIGYLKTCKQTCHLMDKTFSTADLLNDVRHQGR
jgi:sulfite reductase (NADPH) hemoprotein beta-component